MSEIIEYAVFSTGSEAETLLNEISKVKGRWAQPIKHPTQESCLVPIDWSQLRDCEDLLRGIETISKAEAKRQGWYFGPFKGALSRERDKLEDLHFIFDAIVSLYGKPNFPALRALVLSFLSACYALRESLRSICTRGDHRGKLEDWWNDRRKELDARGELLQAFEQFMHNEKHGGPNAGQHSELDIVPHAVMTSLRISSFPIGADASTLRLSAQGAFVKVLEGTFRERRLPVGIQDALYEVVVENPPQVHLGHSIEGASFMQMITMIRDYYAQMVFDAEVLVGERTLGGPAMDLTGEQNLKV